MAYRDEHHNSMPYLSEAGLRMERHLKDLADRHGYRKLSTAESQRQRSYYMSQLDSFWRNGEFLDYEIRLTTHDGTCLATGVSDRGFVCGDYGIFLEIEDGQIVRDSLKVQPGEEYRIRDADFKSKVKYFWFTDRENNGIKMYFQQKGVTYADYKAGKWYVSPYEVRVVKVRRKEIASQQEQVRKKSLLAVKQQGDKPAVTMELF